MIRIAVCQTRVSPSIAENGRAIDAALCEAASAGARLALFCEGALSGYAKAQIASPEAWRHFDWAAQDCELARIGERCRVSGLGAVVGGAHRSASAPLPHNCLYVFGPTGSLLTRYDKRLLSYSETNGWYTPGRDAVTFSIDGFSFGCAICIEVQFPEIFMAYERMAVDAVLFASYGIPEFFQVALRAHAGLNCLWIAGATPAETAPNGPSGIIGPDGGVISACRSDASSDLATAVLDRDDPRFEIALKRARPWRAAARSGATYRA